MPAALCLTGLALALTGFSLFTLDRLKMIILARGAVEPALLVRSLGAGDVLLACAVVVFAGALAVLEWRQGAVRRLLAEGPNALLLGVLAALVIWFAHAPLGAGLLVTGDAGSHVARVAHLMAAWQDGQSLSWDNDYFAGGPLLQFTGPLFHWLATVLGLLVGDATAAVKMLVVGLRLAGALLMYAFLTRCRLVRGGAFLGALFYAGGFVQTYLLSVRCCFPQALTLALLPALFLGLEKVLSTQRLRDRSLLLFSLAAALLTGAHQPTAAVAALFAAAYGALRAPYLLFRVAMVPRLAVAALLTGLAALYFVLPFLLEKSWTAENVSAEVLSLQAPRLAGLLRWGAGGVGRDYTAYLGLSVLICFVSGLPAQALRRVRPDVTSLWRVSAFLAVVSLILAGNYVRGIVFTLFFVSVAAAAAVQAWMEGAPWARHVPALVLTAFLLDMGPTAVQPWTRRDMQAIAKAGDIMAARAPGQRVLELDISRQGIDVPVGPGASPLLYARVQALYGPHKMDATQAHNALAAISQRARVQLQASGTLDVVEAGLLSLCNVGWVVGVDGPRMGLPTAWKGLRQDPVFGGVLRVGTATPFITSGRLQPAMKPADFGGPPLWREDFAGDRGRRAEEAAVTAWRGMGVDLGARQASAFLVPEQGMDVIWPGQSGAPPHATMTAYRVRQGDVALSLDATGEGYVRLAHPFFPSLAVTLNGGTVQARPDIFGMMILPLHTGLNDIHIVARVGPLRRICFAISMVSLLGLAVALCALSLRAAVRAPVRPRRTGRAPWRPGGRQDGHGAKAA